MAEYWPQDDSRRVVGAQLQAVDVAQTLYRKAFRHAAGKQRAVQIPLSGTEYSSSYGRCTCYG